MDFFKKNRRVILFCLLYAALFLLGISIYELLDKGIDSNRSIYIQLSPIIAHFLLAFGCFWELYLAKKNNRNSSNNIE